MKTLEEIEQLIREGKKEEAAYAILENPEARDMAIKGALTKGKTALAVKIMTGGNNEN